MLTGDRAGRNTSPGTHPRHRTPVSYAVATIYRGPPGSLQPDPTPAHVVRAQSVARPSPGGLRPRRHRGGAATL